MQKLRVSAYNRPAYYLLVSHHLITSNTNPFPRLCALIAYLPLDLTDQDDFTQGSDIEETCTPACSSTENIFEPGPSATFLPIQIHIQGGKVNPCTFWPWISLSASEGDTTYKKRHRCHVFTYPDSQAGFAERSSSNYQVKNGNEDEAKRGDDHISTQLSWSRALGCLRRAFGVGINWPVLGIETVWEEYWQRLLADLDHWKDWHRQGLVSGSVMDILGGRRDMSDEDGISVECVPSKAGGEPESSIL